MAMTEAQKRYQNSEKGKIARKRYHDKKRAQKQAATQADTTNQPAA